MVVDSDAIGRIFLVGAHVDELVIRKCFMAQCFRYNQTVITQIRESAFQMQQPPDFPDIHEARRITELRQQFGELLPAGLIRTFRQANKEMIFGLADIATIQSSRGLIDPCGGVGRRTWGLTCRRIGPPFRLGPVISIIVLWVYVFKNYVVLPKKEVSI